MARLIYCAPYFWPEVIGSAPYCTDLARDLVRAGHDLGVLAFRPHYPGPQGFEAWASGARDREHHVGATIARVPALARGTSGALTRLRNDLRYAVAAWRQVRNTRDADIILVNVPGILGAFGAWVAQRGRPIVVIVHDIESGLAAKLGGPGGALMARALGLVERFTLNRSARVIVLSDAMAKVLRQGGVSAPIEVIELWAEIAPYQPPAEGPISVGYRGNFGRKQGLDQILPLIRHVAGNLPDVTCVLAGEGPERAKIEAIIRDEDLARVTFEGVVAPEDLLNRLRATHLHLVPQALGTGAFVLPSKAIAILAAGRAFLGIAEAGSPLDQLATASGAGLCVAPGDPGALILAAQSLLGAPERLGAMGRAGHAYAQAHLHRDAVMARYRAVIDAVGPS